ncbi:MAG: UDP-N-acetylmuramoyl-L-alanine--D-glutamate ligase [Eggerthellaceae bacterium]|nr:UDP-N-acetylmuramoyl-L-alanine--D-glutamate ligase [Eggerthellaceae bacterium]
MKTSVYDPAKKQAPQSLGRVCVLGLGKSGRIAADYCVDLLGTRVSSVFVAAGKPNAQTQDFAQTLIERGAQVVYGEDALDDVIKTLPEGEKAFNVCIASPGISEFSDFYQAAVRASEEVISEVEFAWRESDAHAIWIAITGTNGKTTTTALTAHLLRACGKRAQAVGNIGDTCLEAVRAHHTDYYVAEVSSYQLASTIDFAPDVAVLLNITPDHLAWHKNMDAYIAAKQKVYANAKKLVVLDATNDVVRELTKAIKARPEAERGFDYLPLGCAKGITYSMHDACGSKNAAFLDNGVLRVDLDGNTHRLIEEGDLQIKGEHNVSNALAAASAVLGLVDNVDGVREGLISFAPLEHRIEPCGSVMGVACYNDSKATNVDATLKALAAFGNKRPLVLLGGDDKGTDLSELVAEAEAHTKGVVCFGEAGDRFFAAFAESSLPHVQANHLEDAFDAALAQAESGDIVILSPACASFDEFSCYQERGKVFKQMVVDRAQTRGA